MNDMIDCNELPNCVQWVFMVRKNLEPILKEIYQSVRGGEDETN